MTGIALPADIEDAIAAAALTQDPVMLQALEVLAETMDVFAVDESTSPERRQVVEAGLAAVLDAATVRALVDGTDCPARIAERFFRLRRLAALSAAVGGGR